MWSDALNVFILVLSVGFLWLAISVFRNAQLHGWGFLLNSCMFIFWSINGALALLRLL